MSTSKTPYSHLTDEELLSYASQVSNSLTESYLEVELRKRLEERLGCAISDELKEIFYDDLGVSEEEITEIIEVCDGDLRGAVSVLKILQKYGYEDGQELQACLDSIVQARSFLMVSRKNKEQEK